MNQILDRFTGNLSPVALLTSSLFWSWFDIVPFSPALFITAGFPVDVTPFTISLITSTLLLTVYLVRGKNHEALTTFTTIQTENRIRESRSRKILGCDPYFLLMVLVICISFGFTNYQAVFAAAPQGVGFDYMPIVIRAITSFIILGGYLFFSWRPYALLKLA